MLLILNGLQVNTPTANMEISIYVLERSDFSDGVLIFLLTIQTHQWS